jgi:hypothetical protein
VADLGLVNQQRQAMGALTRLALQDVVGLHGSLPIDRPAAYRTAVMELLPPLLEKWGDAAATISADFYDESRAAAEVSGRFRAGLAEVRADEVSGLVHWATEPLGTASPLAGEVLRRLAGGMERLVRMAERDTIETATGSDPAGPKLQRVTRANACGFCLMLASRGAEHVDMTRARRRMKGKGWHNHCRCGLTPMFGDGRDNYPDPRELYRYYDQVVRGYSNDRDRRLAWDRFRRSAAGGDGGGPGGPLVPAGDAEVFLPRLTNRLLAEDVPVEFGGGDREPPSYDQVRGRVALEHRKWVYWNANERAVGERILELGVDTLSVRESERSHLGEVSPDGVVRGTTATFEIKTIDPRSTDPEGSVKKWIERASLKSRRVVIDARAVDPPMTVEQGREAIRRALGNRGQDLSEVLVLGPDVSWP